MLFANVLATASCLATQALAASVPKRLAERQAPSPSASAPDAAATACGDLIDLVNEGYNVFNAGGAYACLSTVPFNPAVATRFVKYWNETIQFQSTLSYLKSPPQGYQQPAVDVQAELQKIQQRIDSDFYTSQYAFESDFQLLVYAAHDSHVGLNSGILQAFTFAAPYAISAASVDGKQPPKVWITTDIIDSQEQGWHPSAIKTINGQDVVEYLTRYAALNSDGNVEPHADWNALMDHPALDIQGLFAIFAGSGTFYPGENVTFAFENSTTLTDNFLAIYEENANATGPLTTGGDFYNYFVLGLLPASYNPAPTLNDPDATENTTSYTSWYEESYHAYPQNPIVVQPDLSVEGGGVVTGYILDGNKTAVLSLPTFQQTGDFVGAFAETIGYFIGNASQADNLIIDLQQNTGGAALLAFDTFKRFFPDLDPYAGSRRRSFEMANIIGNATTAFFNSLDDSNDDEAEYKEQISADEWVITTRLNAATGRNFTSWTEYQGPITANGDFFSLTERYDLANPTFDAAAFDQWIPGPYLKDAGPPGPRPWEPDHIAILTDGLCASTCALFLEMMTRAGVKTIVAGGRPSTGPMQAASGNRGAVSYTSDLLDTDIEFARNLTSDSRLPAVRDSGIFITSASFNLRDQVRKDDNTPIQFKYEAADCRIYYTLANVYNATRLWTDAARAIFEDPSLCVEGSTGYSTTNNTVPKTPPKPDSSRPILTTPLTQVVDFQYAPDGGLPDLKDQPGRTKEIVQCGSGNSCSDGVSICKKVPITCSNNVKKEVNACLPPCSSSSGNSGCSGFCDINNKQEAKVQSSGGKLGGKLHSGLCYPNIGTKALGCPDNPKKPK